MPEFNFNLNHLVAFLGLILAITLYLGLKKLHFPDKICLGAAILSILMIATFWSAVILTSGDDDEE